MLTNEVKIAIHESVLCWLATVSADGEPNVSPKEMFVALDDKTLLIANIASPESVKNITVNPKVCVSFVNVFSQKGYKLSGRATIIEQSFTGFSEKAEFLYENCGGRDFEIISVIAISVTTVKSILAPSYWMFPDTTEASQIKQAMQAYGVMPIADITPKP